LLSLLTASFLLLWSRSGMWRRSSAIATPD
jgi:hypothetical protein